MMIRIFNLTRKLPIEKKCDIQYEWMHFTWKLVIIAWNSFYLIFPNVFLQHLNWFGTWYNAKLFYSIFFSFSAILFLKFFRFMYTFIFSCLFRYFCSFRIQFWLFNRQIEIILSLKLRRSIIVGLFCSIRVHTLLM